MQKYLPGVVCNPELSLLIHGFVNRSRVNGPGLRAAEPDGRFGVGTGGQEGV